MNDQQIITTTVPTDESSEAPVLVVKIGKIPYRVRLYSSTTNKEMR